MLLFLLLISLCIKAQRGEPTIDSIKEVIEAVPAQKDSEAAAGDEKKYFLEKEQFPERVDSFHLRRLPDSLVKKMQADDDFWYANATIKKEKPKKNDVSYTPL